MQFLIWTGAGMTFIGLLGLLWCIFKAAAAKRANLSEKDMRDRLARLVPVNLASLLVSALGLMMVIVGIVLS